MLLFDTPTFDRIFKIHLKYFTILNFEVENLAIFVTFNE